MTAAARLLALPVLLLPLAAAAQTPPNAAPEATLQACFAELQPAASTPASAPSSAPTDTSATASPAGASPDEPPTGGSVTPVASRVSRC